MVAGGGGAAGRPRALLVDLDDTVLDWSRRHEVPPLICDEIATIVPGLDRAALARAYEELTRAYVPMVQQLCWTGGMRGAALRSEVWRRSLAAAGCPAGHLPAAVAHAQQRQRQLELERYRMYPDAHRLLAATGGFAIPVAVVTNGPTDTQREKLHALRRMFTPKVTAISGEVGFAKPDRRIFQHACRALGVAAEHAWHIGDSLTHDVAGAQAAGVFAVWLNRSGRTPSPDRPTPDWVAATLDDVVAAWRGSACG